MKKIKLLGLIVIFILCASLIIAEDGVSEDLPQQQQAPEEDFPNGIVPLGNTKPITPDHGIVTLPGGIKFQGNAQMVAGVVIIESGDVTVGSGTLGVTNAELTGGILSITDGFIDVEGKNVPVKLASNIEAVPGGFKGVVGSLGGDVNEHGLSRNVQFVYANGKLTVKADHLSVSTPTGPRIISSGGVDLTLDTKTNKITTKNGISIEDEVLGKIKLSPFPNEELDVTITDDKLEVYGKALYSIGKDDITLSGRSMSEDGLFTFDGKQAVINGINDFYGKINTLDGFHGIKGFTGMTVDGYERAGSVTLNLNNFNPAADLDGENHVVAVDLGDIVVGKKDDGAFYSYAPGNIIVHQAYSEEIQNLIGRDNMEMFQNGILYSLSQNRVRGIRSTFKDMTYRSTEELQMYAFEKVNGGIFVLPPQGVLIATIIPDPKVEPTYSGELIAKYNHMRKKSIQGEPLTEEEKELNEFIIKNHLYVDEETGRFVVIKSDGSKRIPTQEEIYGISELSETLVIAEPVIYETTAEKVSPEVVEEPAIEEPIIGEVQSGEVTDAEIVEDSETEEDEPESDTPTSTGEKDGVEVGVEVSAEIVGGIPVEEVPAEETAKPTEGEAPAEKPTEEKSEEAKPDEKTKEERPERKGLVSRAKGVVYDATGIEIDQEKSGGFRQLGEGRFAGDVSGALTLTRQLAEGEIGVVGYSAEVGQTLGLGVEISGGMTKGEDGYDFDLGVDDVTYRADTFASASAEILNEGLIESLTLSGVAGYERAGGFMSGDLEQGVTSAVNLNLVTKPGTYGGVSVGALVGTTTDLEEGDTEVDASGKLTLTQGGGKSPIILTEQAGFTYDSERVEQLGAFVAADIVYTPFEGLTVDSDVIKNFGPQDGYTLGAGVATSDLLLSGLSTSVSASYTEDLGGELAATAKYQPFDFVTASGDIKVTEEGKAFGGGLRFNYYNALAEAKYRERMDGSSEVRLFGQYTQPGIGSLGAEFVQPVYGNREREIILTTDLQPVAWIGADGRVNWRSGSYYMSEAGLVFTHPGTRLCFGATVRHQQGQRNVQPGIKLGYNC